jgi:hypothetical protein
MSGLGTKGSLSRGLGVWLIMTPSHLRARGTGPAGYGLLLAAARDDDPTAAVGNRAPAAALAVVSLIAAVPINPG